MSGKKVKKTLATKAFGVEQGKLPYRLRQARYYELGGDVARWAGQHVRQFGRPLELLDIGTYDGVARKYIEARPGGEHVRYHGVDIFPRGKEHVYKWQDWTLHHINLENGLPGLPSNTYDVVICEQVLEHLHRVDLALVDMVRVLRPGGRIILGVPIFPHGAHLVRKHVVPVTDRWFKVKKKRGHVQAWSSRTFQKLVRETCPNLTIEKSRGFRIVSGGILGPLEHYRWWWRLNRKIGSWAPSLCIEIQLIAQKQIASDLASPPLRAAA